jgi:hypothetical protein
MAFQQPHDLLDAGIGQSRRFGVGRQLAQVVASTKGRASGLKD